MASTRPFVDGTTGALDTDQILVEAVPLAKLIGLFVAVAIVPFTLAYFGGPSPLGALFALAGQFVLAVGSGLVLIYVVARALQLAGVADAHADDR